tara:strand:- start:1747 stop:3066 length:1320 start_codon:yes stop_codon:yes gene_type:complete
MREKCGVFGTYTKTKSYETIPYVVQGLKLLQHRGQESCGIAYEKNDSLFCQTKPGLVKHVFKDIKSDKILSNKCIGHVRYSTSGNSKNDLNKLYSECQPLYGKCKLGGFFIAHNGNVPDLNEHDTQYIISFIQKSSCSSWCEILIKLLDEIPVAYCLLIITNDAIYAVRDRYGIRPLCIGQDKEVDFCFSSESCALQHFTYIRDVYPGEVVMINKDGLKRMYTFPHAILKLCAFECIYFMKDNSICNGMLVSEMRKLFGKELANKERCSFDDNTIVVGVPMSGIVSAKSYADALRLPYLQLIDKNKNIGRTFIAPSNEERLSLCRQKFLFRESEIKDKNIIIVDDTVVRGNVIKTIVEQIYKCGAKDVHIRIPSPKIVDKCTLGIDIPSREELLAFNKNNLELAKELKVLTINYLDYNDLDKILPFSTYKECFGEKIEY